MNMQLTAASLSGEARRARIAKALVFAAVLLGVSAIIVLAASFQGVSAFADESLNDSEISVDVSGQFEGHSSVLYDSTNGLPTSEANAITETSEGFIWIGSYSGLIRYDGTTFERIDSTTGIASVVCLYVDAQNRLWIGTNDGGIAMMDKGDVRRWTKDDGLRSLSIRSIVEDESGTIYVATTSGLAKIDENLKLSTVDEPQLNGQYIRSLQLGPDSVIYGVTTDGAIFTISGGKLSGYHAAESMGISGVISLLPDPQKPGYVYIGTSRSSLYYGNLDDGMKDADVLDASPLSYINSIKLIEDQIWLCADNGIGIIENGVCSRLSHVPLDNSVEHVMTDYEGNLWFTSSRQGVMKIVPNQFLDVFEKYGLEPVVVNSTCVGDDVLYIGTDSGLRVVDKQNVITSLPLTNATTASGELLNDVHDLFDMLGSCRIRSIVRDTQGSIWFSTYSHYGLVRYSDGRATCFTKSDGMLSERVRTVTELDDGSIMAACSGGGVVRIMGNEIIKRYDETSGLSNTEILTIAQTSKNELLFGSDGDGIYLVTDSNITRMGTESGLTSDVVMRLKPDAAHNVIWIITSNSIAFMTEDHTIQTVLNFPYSNNFDMHLSKDEKMWVLSSNGIYVVPVSEMLANGDINPVHYNSDNGLPCMATANSFSALTEDGFLYMAGGTGVARVNIDTPFESVGDVKMAVPYIEVDGQMTYPNDDGSFTIPSHAQKLTIYSFAFAYSLLNPNVTYYLDGFDRESTTLVSSELSPIDYTNLGGGEYRFVMQLQDSLGRGNSELAIQIKKEYAIYEMLWFRILCALAIIGIITATVLLYVRRKTRALTKKHEETKQLIREITQAFAKVIDMKDKYTNGHSSRVAEYTVMLACELGYDEETVERYQSIALLHDVGKIGVPANVLNKKGRLTDEEFRIIKSHSALGYHALKDISIMPELAIGAGAHHERPDGKGYPRGLKGDEIPRVAQIIAVADTFDAMYSNRPYRDRMNFDKVVSIIKEVRGTQLASDVVDAFLRLVDKGEFRDPDDHGGGSTEDIDNIHRKFERERGRQEAQQTE